MGTLPENSLTVNDPPRVATPSAPAAEPHTTNGSAAEDFPFGANAMPPPIAPPAATTTSPDARSYFLACARAAIAVTPIRTNGSKAPILLAWQSQPAPTDAEITSWLARGYGIGARCGKASGNLELLDFDEEAETVFGVWQFRVECDAPGLVDRLTIHGTPRNEYSRHVAFRCAEVEIPGNAKLAERAAVDPETGKTVLIETRGEGGQFLLPGCPPECHEESMKCGRLYRHLSGPPLHEVATITAAEREVLFRAARSLDRCNAPEINQGSAPTHGDLRPGEDYSKRGPDFGEIIGPHGWRFVKKAGNADLYCRPGKDASKGHSATANYCISKSGWPLFYVFTSNGDPFESGKAYSRFACHTLLNHNGDYKAAARELGKQGYGSAGSSPSTNGTATDAAQTADQRFQNYREIAGAKKGDKETTIKVGLSAAEIKTRLDQLTGGWPKRVSTILFVPGDDHSPLWLESADAAFAWIGATVSRGQRDNQTSWVGGQDNVSQAQFFHHLTQAAEAFEAVESFPHHPELPRHYYMHAPTTGGDGQALATLLQRFTPATPVDADLIRALFLTLAWSGRSGQRPAFFIAADRDDPRGGRGLGKTKLIQAAAHVVGGHLDVRPNEDIDNLKTRLLSPPALSRRVVLLDNLKELHFSWEELESLITSDVISGRRLYVGEGTRTNNLLWCLTSNRATLSKDLAQRCVILRLKRPVHDPSWESDTFGYIEAHRWAILGDILAELRRPPAPLARFSRWSSWERDVLSHTNDPTQCQATIEERQRAIDADQEEADLVKHAFEKYLANKQHDPASCAVWIPTRDVAEILKTATGEPIPINKASAHLASLGIAELRKSDRANAKGWTWRGKAAPAAATTAPAQANRSAEPQ